MIWFTSDTHFAHSNICYATSKWPDKETSTRKFDSIQDMNQTIIKNINDCVKKDDELYFLGDWCMNGIQNIYNFYKQLNCKNIYFVPGNHDQHIKKNKIIIDDFGFQIPVQELFKVLPELTTLVINKKRFVLSHYPLEQWEDMDIGSIHLHGHCHGKINDCEINTKYKRMDVGLDWKEFRPYSLDEILKIMEKREIKKHTS